MREGPGLKLHGPGLPASPLMQEGITKLKKILEGEQGEVRGRAGGRAGGRAWRSGGKPPGSTPCEAPSEAGCRSQPPPALFGCRPSPQSTT